MSEDAAYLRTRVADLERKNEDLVKDNGGQRDEIRDLKADKLRLEGEVQTLKDSAPKEGSVILSSDAEKAKWKKFSELGAGDDKGDPDKIAARLMQGAKDAQAVLRNKNAASLGKLGYKSSLLRLPEFDNIEISTTEEQGENDETLVRGKVKVNGEEKSFIEWVKANDLEDVVTDFATDETTSSSSTTTSSTPKVIGQKGPTSKSSQNQTSVKKYIEEAKNASKKEATK